MSALIFNWSKWLMGIKNGALDMICTSVATLIIFGGRIVFTKDIWSSLQ